MKKAALYARVSSDMQRKEGTIDSQIAELKKQIMRSGDTLVKEYVDDGHSGALLDRPSMNELREDLKTDLFESVYFLNTDRIARDVTYQNIVIGEILRHKKQIVINGKDYVHNPENKFTLTVLGAVSELERAKIIERCMRGRKHWLKQGVLMSNGCYTFGYHYHRKNGDTSASFEINKKEAVIIRKIYEMYAKGDIGFMEITQQLIKEQAYRKPGSKPWNKNHVRYILHNEMYTGIRYFDTMTDANEDQDPMHKTKVKSMKMRDRRDWIGIKIPQIIPNELFEKVKSKIEHNKSCYRNAQGKQLLSNLLWCGKCGCRCFSFRQYYWIRRSKASQKIYEKLLYTCSGRKNVGSCDTKQTDVRAINACVFRTIEQTMFNPADLKTCMSGLKSNDRTNKQKIEKQLKEIDRKLSDISNRKSRIIDLYASGGLDREEYQKRITSYDNESKMLKEKRDGLTKRTPIVYKAETIDSAIKKYCEDAKERFEECDDHESKRRFLLDFIEKVTFRNDRITVQGSISIETSKIEFVIKRKIDRDQLLETVLKNDRGIGLRGTTIKRADFGRMANGEAEILTPSKLLTPIHI